MFKKKTLNMKLNFKKDNKSKANQTKKFNFLKKNSFH